MRTLCELTRADEHIMRSPSSWALISRLKMATGALPSTATFWAMLSARDVLPTPGRAARTMRLAFWKPPVSLSMPSKPVATPLTPLVLLA